jgi:hypothetical protein
MLPPAPPPGARACSVPKTLSCHRGSSIIPKHIPTHALQCIHCTHTYTYTQRKQRPRCGWFELGEYHAAQRSIISICSHRQQQRREDMGCSAQGVQLHALHIHRPCINNDACGVQLAARERHSAAPALRKKAAIGAWLPWMANPKAVYPLKPRA